VTFTTFTLLASALLFQGFNTTSPINTITLFCGFLVIFSGVYLLNLSRDDPDGHGSNANKFSDAPPTDGIAGYQTRRSLQARRSSVEASMRRSRDSREYGGRDSMGLGDRERLMRGYDDHDVEAQFGLADLAEDSEEDNEVSGGSGKRTSFDDGCRNENGNGAVKELGSKNGSKSDVRSKSPR
jgi:magnesium transporter